MRKIEYLSGITWHPLHDSESLGQHLSEASLIQSANAIGSLTLRFLPTSDALENIACNTLVRVYNDSEQEWEFYGRVIDVTPGMDDDGTVYKEAVCEDALGFLQDTAVWFDSRKDFFDGANSSYPVDIDEDDGSRTMASASLAKLLVSQHNNTIADNGGDAWKKVKLGTVGVSSSKDTTFSAEYEATTYEMLSAVADDASAEFRSRYDGTNVYIDMAESLGSDAGTFKVGDNVAQTALKTSMADVVTRMFPYGDEYAKLEKKERKGTTVTGALKGGEWDSSAKYKTGGAAKMVRFNVEGSVKCVLKVDRRNKDYAMVFFTDGLVTSKSSKVLKKYVPGSNATANVTKRYPVPDGAKYCYVFGDGSACTTYGYYKNSAGNTVKKNYRTDLGFWMGKLTSSEIQALIDANCPGATIGSVVDGSNDRSYYLAMNEDRYGAIEGTCLKEKQLNTDKITNARKAVYSINDLKANKTRAKRFIKYACQQLKDRCTEAVELTVTGYDLSEAGLDYDAIKLYDRWTVVNELCGINHTAEVVRIHRDLLRPWDVEVELGSKVERATGAGKCTSASLTAGIKPSADGDDDDSEADDYATLAGQMAEAAEKAAEVAVEKADELDKLSYLIQVDSLAAGQMASDAYDTVLPITDAMRGLLEDAEEQANSITSVKEAQQQTISLTNDLARATASYAYETEKSVVRWRQTYTADLDAWASEDPDVQAEIAAAYALLYGANGTADSPEADSAQGHLNAAKTANVEAATTEAAMKVELANANAYQASCSAAADKASAAAQKAQAAYDALKKKTKASRKELDAAKAVRDAALKKEAQSQDKVDAANERCAEAEENYTAAQEALATAEAQVAAAQAEVDTAMNGIHQHYQTVIEQTANKVRISATEETVDNKYQAALEVTARAIQSMVSSAGGSSTSTQTADGIIVTVTSPMTNVADGTARNTASSAASTASSAASTASSAASTANTALSSVNTVKTMVRQYGSGVLVCKTGNTVGALVNANGSFDVVSVSWSGETPTAGSTISSFSGSSIVLSGSSSVKIEFGDGDYYIEANKSGIGIEAKSFELVYGGELYFGVSASSVACLPKLKTYNGITANGGDITGACTIKCEYDSYHDHTNGRHGLYSTTASKWLSWANSSGECYYHGDSSTASSKFAKYDITKEDEDKASSLLGIDVVRFKYKAGFRNGHNDNSYHYGVIAEDVYSDFPDVVTNPDQLHLDALIPAGEDTSGIGVDYSKFVPHLIKLCQMQQQQIDDLKARVEALEAK